MERTRQSKWDAKHLHTVGTKLTRREYEQFRKDCEAEGITPYALLRQLLKEWQQWG